MKALSLPHEHGAYLTLVGATAAGVALAERPLPAFGVGLALAAAFFARGPVEAHHRGRFDKAASIIYALLAFAGITLAHQPLLALFVIGLVVVSFWMRAEKRHRDALFELAGMAALGAASGAIARIGGADADAALLSSLVMAAHAAVAVPLVRSELRPRERALAPRVVLGASLALLLAALLLLRLGGPLLPLTLLPRLVTLVTRGRIRKPAWIGLRETVALAATVALLVITLPKV